VRAFALVLLAGCGLDMTGATPWIPIEEVSGPLVAERVAGGTSFAQRSVPASPLRVVTYNFEYAPDPDALASALLADPELARAGVVLVQETEAHDDEARSRTMAVAEKLGFGFVYVPARTIPGGTHGLAILSAFPITDVAKMDLPESSRKSQHRIAIQATIDVAGTPLHVIDLHLDTMLNAQQRIAQLSPIVMGSPEATLIAGDFNTSWVQWVDGTVPVLSSTGAPDQAPVIDDYMRAQGFATPTADSGPTEHMFGLEQRLDAIYTRGPIATFGGVPRVGPSDHWPMWIDLALQ
jgi:endonuclease/exonuclease/phosphatase family metal-dependent hydrolase